jgi:hypothetical protein
MPSREIEDVRVTASVGWGLYPGDAQTIADQVPQHAGAVGDFPCAVAGVAHSYDAG